MHGWAQERLQIYLRRLDKVKKSTEQCASATVGRFVRDASPAVEFRHRFAMARPLFLEIPLLLGREESKALCLESFALKTELSVWRQLSRMSHVLGFEDVVELGLGKQFFFEYQFVDATVGHEGFLCDTRALFVAEHRVEGSDQPDGILHIGETTFAVSFDASNAAGVEDNCSVAQECETEKQVKGDDRLGHIQLKFARFAGHGDSDVGSNDLETDLADHFGNYRVHFAGHDGRARLHRRQADLVKSAPWPGRKPAQVVADFGKLHGGGLHHATYQCELARILRCFDQITSQRYGQAADFREAFRA